MFCNRCTKEVKPKESIQRFANDTYHVRGDCTECGGYSKWISYADSVLVKRLVKYEYNRSSRPVSADKTNFAS